MITTSGPGITKTFVERSTISLDGKEGQMVELHTDGTVQLHTTGAPIGVYEGKLQNGSKNVTVRLIGYGTARMVQAGAIAPGARVKPDGANKIVTSGAAPYKSTGVKIAPATAGVADDVIEVLLKDEYVAA